MNTLKFLPALHKVIDSSELSLLRSQLGVGVFSILAKEALEITREKITKKETRSDNSDEDSIRNSYFESVINELQQLSAALPTEQRSAINATGILLHTGLGRAPIGNTSNLTMAAGYNAVQIDRLSGARSLREDYIELLLRELVGAESSTVINNNAAATFLMLKSICKGKEVIISRGQLVEIGGSYRMPDIMQESGCIMREVGTTNKTHLLDYSSAITENTGALLFVHQSNFKIEGFTSTPSLKELCTLGEKHNIPVLADLGSGALVDVREFGLPYELQVKEVISAGAAVCCFSGDKLLGGPQAGILCGQTEFIEKIRKDPFSRMFRVCKLTLRALESALESYANNTFREEIPIYQLLGATVEQLKHRAESLSLQLQTSIIPGAFSSEPSEAYMGGGSSADAIIPSYALCLTPIKPSQAHDAIKNLRLQSPGVYGRLRDGKLIFDLRGVFEKDDSKIITAFSNLNMT